MIRVHIFCEGQTEETFVREVLSNHFEKLNIWLNPILLRTSRHGKGGISSYEKIKWQIQKKCKEDTLSWVTTLIDFYGLPQDFPDMQIHQKIPSIEKALVVEKAFEKDISHSNFIGNLIVHEFEGLLFSSPQAFATWYDNQSVIESLMAIRAQFASPEHINQGIPTAPSKRILGICNDYNKVLHGSLISLEIGLDTIRKECPLFNKWIDRLEKLPQ